MIFLFVIGCEELRLKSEQTEKDLKSYLENGVGNSKGEMK